MEEISEDSEKLPPTVKLTLLQTAVRSINEIKIVETPWMSSKAPPMDMDPPLPCPMTPTMIY